MDGLLLLLFDLTIAYLVLLMYLIGMIISNLRVVGVSKFILLLLNEKPSDAARVKTISIDLCINTSKNWTRIAGSV